MPQNKLKMSECQSNMEGQDHLSEARQYAMNLARQFVLASESAEDIDWSRLSAHLLLSERAAVIACAPTEPASERSASRGETPG